MVEQVTNVNNASGGFGLVNLSILHFIKGVIHYKHKKTDFNPAKKGGVKYYLVAWGLGGGAHLSLTPP